MWILVNATAWARPARAWNRRNSALFWFWQFFAELLRLQFALKFWLKWRGVRIFRASSFNTIPNLRNTFSHWLLNACAWHFRAKSVRTFQVLRFHAFGELREHLRWLALSIAIFAQIFLVHRLLISMILHFRIITLRSINFTRIWALQCELFSKFSLVLLILVLQVKKLFRFDLMYVSKHSGHLLLKAHSHWHLVALKVVRPDLSHKFQLLSLAQSFLLLAEAEAAIAPVFKHEVTQFGWQRTIVSDQKKLDVA